MTCREFEEALQSALHGEPCPEGATAHLKACATCRERAAEVLRLHESLSRALRASPSNLADRLSATLRQIEGHARSDPERLEAARQKIRRLWRRRARPVSVLSGRFVGVIAAGVLIGLAVLFGLFRPPVQAPVTAERIPASIREAPRGDQAVREPQTHVRPPPENPKTIERPAPKPPELEVVPEPPKQAAEPVPDAKPPQNTAPGPVEKTTSVQRFLAVLDQVEGDVRLRNRPAQEGEGILPGDELAATLHASVSFPDKTRLDVGERAEVRFFEDRAKRILVTRGTVDARVSRQPKDQPMIFETPQATAVVLGTVLRIAVDSASTRVEVTEGRVRLKRALDGRTIQLVGGQGAIAASGASLAARLLTNDELLLRMDFEDGILPPRCKVGMLEKKTLAGVKLPGPKGVARIMLEDDQGLYAFSESLLLNFDYWVDSKVSTLDLYVWNRTRQRAFGTTVWNARTEQWRAETLKFADFKCDDSAWHAGDQVTQLVIQVGQPEGSLHVKNLEILRPRRFEKKK